jgi:uncharacterized protein YbjT (DUF2867 family)
VLRDQKCEVVALAAKTVAVIGATGRIGRQVVIQLAERRVWVRAVSRHLAPAGKSADQIEPIAADITNPASLTTALRGVDAAFLAFPSVAADHAAAPLVSALAQHVGRIVYLSAAGAPSEVRPDGAAPDGTILGSHAYVEALIAAGPMAWTFLRSSGFAANTLGWAPQLRRSDTLRWFYGTARRALIHERDLGIVAAHALLEDGHDGVSHHVTGPAQLTQLEQLAAIGEATGRTLRFEELGPDAARQELFANAPPQLAQSILAAHARFVSEPEPVTDTVARITGEAATPFGQWAREHAGEFQ